MTALSLSLATNAMADASTDYFIEGGIAYAPAINTSGVRVYNPNDIAGGSYATDVITLSGDIVIPSTVSHDGTTYNVTEIGNNAFFYPGVTSVKINEGVSYISSSAFYNSAALITVDLPSTVTTLGGLVFEGCSNLETITCRATTPPTSDAISNASEIYLYVPTAAFSSYRNVEPWSSFKRITYIGDKSVFDVSVSESKVYLLPGETHTLTATVHPSTVSAYTLSWIGDPDFTDVAIVNAEGVVTALSSGQIKITARAETAESGARGYCDVIVDPTWTWNGNTGATAVIHDKTTGEVAETLTATVTSTSNNPQSCAEDKVTTYTATVTYNGTTYSNTKVVTVAGSHKLVHVDASEANCIKEGNIEYWHCDGCDKYYADSEGKTEIPYDSVIIPISENHTYELIDDHLNCTVCHEETAVFNKSGVIIEKNGTLLVKYNGNPRVPSRPWKEGRTNFKNDNGDRWRYNNKIYKAIIEEGFTSLPDKFFDYEPYLTEISIPSTMSKIEANAFNNCKNLHTIIFHGATPPTIGSHYAFHYDKFIVPEGTKETYQQEFGKVMSHLNNSALYIEENEQTNWTIETTALANMSGIHIAIGDENLQKVRFLKIKGYINGYDLMVINEKMTELVSIDLRDAVLTANDGGYYCKITSKEILPSPFVSGKKLKYLILPRDIKTMSTNSFGSSDLYYMDVSNVESIENSSTRSDSGPAVAINLCFFKGANVKKLGNRIFVDCHYLKEVDCPLIDKIGKEVFTNCYSLVNNPIANIDTIPDYSFSNCLGLGNLDFPNTTYIRTSAFEGSQFKSINLPQVKTIGLSAFRNSSFSSIYMPVVEELLAGCFVNIGELTEIELPKTLITNEKIVDKNNTFIRTYFSNLSALKKVVLKCPVHMSFYNCPELTTIEINYEYSDMPTFRNCPKLESIYIPNTITTIGDYCFQNCTSLKEVKLPTSVKMIGTYAFNGCTSLEKIHIPSTITEIGDNAFTNCSNLKDIYTYTVEPLKTNVSRIFSNPKNINLYIPKQGYYNYFYDENWRVFISLNKFDEPYEYFYLNNDYLSTNSTGVFEGNPTVDMYAGSSYTLTGDFKQNLSTINYSYDAAKTPSIISNNNNLSVGVINVEIPVTGGNWYFFSFPFNVPLSAVDCGGKQYVFRRYNGENRAAGGSGWENLSSTDTELKAGVGYIFQIKETGTLSMHVPNPNFGSDSKTTSLNSYVSDNAEDASWNFVGNPQYSYFDINSTDYDAPMTVWDNSSKTYVAYRPGDDTYILNPFQAFFVQKATSTAGITFDKIGRETYSAAQASAASSAAPARRKTRAAGRPERQIVNIQLFCDGEDMMDRTRIVFNDKSSLDYELECDAAKFMSSSDVAQIYTIDRNLVNYSINERPYDDGKINLGFSAPYAGEYTLSADRLDIAMDIYDYYENCSVDLTKGNYTFRSNAGTFDDRFSIVRHAPTGINEIEEKVFGAVSIGGAIQFTGINGEPAYIYSMDGQLISEVIENGIVNVEAGIYAIKCGNRTFKIRVQ